MHRIERYVRASLGMARLLKLARRNAGIRVAPLDLVAPWPKPGRALARARGHVDVSVTALPPTSPTLRPCAVVPRLATCSQRDKFSPAVARHCAMQTCISGWSLCAIGPGIAPELQSGCSRPSTVRQQHPASAPWGGAWRWSPVVRAMRDVEVAATWARGRSSAGAAKHP